MPGRIAFVVVMTTPSPPIAHLVAERLIEEGIPALVPGMALQDEWAISQKIMGLMNAEVRVPADRVADAQAVLEKLKAAESLGADESAEEGESTDDRDGADFEEAERAAEEAPPPRRDLEELAASAAATEEPPSRPSNLTDLAAWAELGVVFSLLVLLLLAWYGGDFWSPLPDSMDAESGRMVLNVGRIAIVLYLFQRSGEGLAHYGLGRVRWLGDSLTAFLVLSLSLLVFYAAAWLNAINFPHLPTESTPTFPDSTAESVVWVIGTFISAFSQELLYRAYLLTRLERLLRSPVWALIASAAVFGAVHFYQGGRGVLSATMFGLCWGALFLIIRRIWPFAVAHAAFNLLLRI